MLLMNRPSFLIRLAIVVAAGVEEAFAHEDDQKSGFRRGVQAWLARHRDKHLSMSLARGAPQRTGRCRGLRLLQDRHP
ncbi:hypothetical protein CLAFUW4_20060 [Fulvia fulva]|uniref:uncharacterized protein n=1 Tax=Passalora fulva TaxID=5499 RepID=UPI00285253E5|nr:uncharacterized protein CLAFUR5_20060 [Fulvia fulva]KAK4622310.1 hypothetical protein CLAFUR4_20060 [Fulvia fulva]KAK4622918.1 hypothetical protein CLAFUR0_20060 [Fulvia fulva]WMI38938.1 hypothetical protein CLAFUR5_20060 [Fulvia fulva]WPV15805.1 hypothetical protein CLAFUW4_20060 [Fulvia fulva]WPV31705.1 hypothetical protein CLAFUW7_20060 [Fulvia fulva]